MPIINWNKAMSIEIVEIDNQHKQLVELINKLYDAIMARESKQTLGGILNSLVDYTYIHFSTEEKYFRNFDYPLTEEHMQEHTNFTDKIADFQKQYQAGKALLSIEVIDFLKEWLMKHIMGSDKKYAPLFKSKGL